MKILFVPDSPLVPHIRIRGEELARHLAKRHELYYLSWGTQDCGNILSQFSFRIQQLFTPKMEHSYGNFTVINSPHSDFYYIKTRIISETILKRSLKFNKKVLKKIVEEKGIDVIINEARQLWDTTDLGVPYIYDVTDMPYNGVFKGLMEKQMVNASQLMCISYYIQKEVREQLNLKSIVIPNGVDLDEFEWAERFEARDFSKTIVGFIGNFGWWSGLDFLLDCFKNLQDEYELWIIGGGSELPNARRRTQKKKIKNVTFMGLVPKNEVIGYFKAIDLGVLPFIKTAFTDAALPIKILEYTAAKKLVLATELEELKTLGLSNVVLRPRNEQIWAETLKELKNRRWNSKWDKEIEKYDWKVLAEKVLALIELL